MYTPYLKLKNQGDQGEQKFIDFLKANGHTDIQHIDDVFENEDLNRSDWDIRSTCPKGFINTYEVKDQQECHKWSMVNIEQVQNGKAAGVSTSKANYYVFTNDTLGFGIIKSSKLKKIHNLISSDTNITKQSYIDKLEVYGVKLWITKYKNYACGYRININKLTWKQPNQD